MLWSLYLWSSIYRSMVFVLPFMLIVNWVFPYGSSIRIKSHISVTVLPAIFKVTPNENCFGRPKGNSDLFNKTASE